MGFPFSGRVAGWFLSDSLLVVGWLGGLYGIPF